MSTAIQIPVATEEQAQRAELQGSAKITNRLPITDAATKLRIEEPPRAFAAIRCYKPGLPLAVVGFAAHYPLIPGVTAVFTFGR